MTDSNKSVIDPEALEILDYWFGKDNLSLCQPDTESSANAKPQPRFKLWFAGGKQVDDDIRSRFEPIIDSAETGLRDHWRHSPHNALALIIVLDQFPLNAFRRTARAFRLGDLALPVCQDGLRQGFDRHLNVLEKLFFYLPLEHSENADDQQQALHLFTQMHQDSPTEYKEFTRKTLESAQEHFDIIREFGRYPFRNRLLNRESTAEELAWIEANPGRFGQ